MLPLMDAARQDSQLLKVGPYRLLNTYTALHAAIESRSINYDGAMLQRMLALAIHESCLGYSCLGYSCLGLRDAH
jgi:hypothetical protein